MFPGVKLRILSDVGKEGCLGFHVSNYYRPEWQLPDLQMRSPSVQPEVVVVADFRRDDIFRPSLLKCRERIRDQILVSCPPCSSSPLAKQGISDVIRETKISTLFVQRTLIARLDNPRLQTILSWIYQHLFRLKCHGKAKQKTRVTLRSLVLYKDPALA